MLFTPILIFLATVFVAAIMQGVIGFGFALVAVPIGLSLLDKSTILSSIIIIGITLNTIVIVSNTVKVDIDVIKDLILTSFGGMIFGVIALQLIPTFALQIGAGSLIVFFSALLFFKKQRSKKSRVATMSAGMISGILNTSTGLSGPPIALLLSQQKVKKEVYKKTLAVFFLFMNCTTLFLYYISHMIAHEGIMVGLYSIPLVVIAGYIGHRISSHVNMKVFNVVALLIILLTGMNSIYKGIVTINAHTHIVSQLKTGSL